MTEASNIGYILYQSRSYLPSGKMRETQTVHIWRMIVDKDKRLAKRTLCGRLIGSNDTNHRWLPAGLMLPGKFTTDVSCLRCLSPAKLASIGYRTRGGLFEQIPRKASQDARSATSEPKATPDQAARINRLLARKEGPETSTDEIWQPPTLDQLDLALQHLMGGYENSNEPLLKHSLVHQDLGRLGRFLDREDWKAVVWAAEAWMSLMVSRDFHPIGDNDMDKAAYSAAKIWRD